MEQIPKPFKWALRQLAEQAYEIELGRELTLLQSELDRWKHGEITAFDVNEAIHRFHYGRARDLYASYTSRHPKAAVAYAIQTGILGRAKIAPNVLEELAGALSRYEALESAQ